MIDMTAPTQADRELAAHFATRYGHDSLAEMILASSEYAEGETDAVVTFRIAAEQAMVRRIVERLREMPPHYYGDHISTSVLREFGRFGA